MGASVAGRAIFSLASVFRREQMWLVRLRHVNLQLLPRSLSLHFCQQFLSCLFSYVEGTIFGCHISYFSLEICLKSHRDMGG